MKIIHCADLHLDSKMESNLDRELAALRRDELLDSFEEMVEFAEEQGVRAILIAGDLFDKPHIRKSAKNRVMEVFASHPQIDFCYLRGNHDNCDIFEEIESGGQLENVRTFGSGQWTTYDYGEATVTGMELTKENAATLGMNLLLDKNRLNIVMLHGQEAERQGTDKTEVVDLTLLRNKNIDYLALGHIHSYKKERLDDRGVYCYSGCLEGRGFDECGEKGFVMLEIENGKIETEFVPFCRRCLHEVNVGVTPEMGMPEMIAAAKSALEKIPSDDLVKIILTGRTAMQNDVDIRRLLRSLDREFFFVKAYDRTSVAVDYESFRNDKSLKGEFVRLMENSEMTEEERSAVIELGLRAIMGEDLEA